MIPVPFWALAALILAVIVFAWLAEAKRREAQQLAQQLAVALQRIGQARAEGWSDGSIGGYKRGWGEAYAAAAKAQRRADDPVAAIVRVGNLNAPALLEREVGEVLEVGV